MRYKNNSSAVHYIHFVRDPRKSLASIRDDLHHKSWNFVTPIINQEFGVDISLPVSLNISVRAALYYFYWNKLVEKTNPSHRWRVEDNASTLLQTIGLQRPPSTLPPRNQNTHVKSGVRTPFDFDLLNNDLLLQLSEMSIRYGYGPIVPTRPNRE